MKGKPYYWLGFLTNIIHRNMKKQRTKKMVQCVTISHKCYVECSLSKQTDCKYSVAWVGRHKCCKYIYQYISIPMEDEVTAVIPTQIAAEMITTFQFYSCVKASDYPEQLEGRMRQILSATSSLRHSRTLKYSSLLLLFIHFIQLYYLFTTIFSLFSFHSVTL